mmetsp:Transcript_57764/g.138690  ORF Transcript_57764/g.138690 Transcript_57764/m.138690 type:complete len:208 (-) Transcript_57764:117-740(-)
MVVGVPTISRHTPRAAAGRSSGGGGGPCHEDSAMSLPRRAAAADASSLHESARRGVSSSAPTARPRSPSLTRGSPASPKKSSALASFTSRCATRCACRCARPAPSCAPSPSAVDRGSRPRARHRWSCTSHLARSSASRACAPTMKHACSPTTCGCGPARRSSCSSRASPSAASLSANVPVEALRAPRSGAAFTAMPSRGKCHAASGR